MDITLKKTKKKGIPFLGADSENKLITGDEYLYTDTGHIKRWQVAMKLSVPSGEEVPDKVLFRMVSTREWFLRRREKEKS